MALLIAGTALAFYEQVSLRHAMARDFVILTDIFDNTVAPGLAFNDPASIDQTLAALRDHQHVVAAGVYDVNGKLVAHYRRAGVNHGFTFPAGELSGQRFGADRLDTFGDIKLAGEKIGVIYIGADLGDLRERAWIYAGMVGALWVVCSLVALILTARLQRIISGPIVDLARTVASVATDRNYAMRAHNKQGDDELGRLVDGFNEMLVQIQTRDSALQQEIVERRRSEEALRESHQRFEIVSRATSDIIWDHDVQTNTVWRNENLQAVLGYEPGEVEPTTEGWSSRVHPQDLPGVEEQLKAAHQNGVRVVSTDYRFRRRDGSYAWILDRAFVIRDEEGRAVRLIGAMQDVTALKEAQAEAAREKDRLQLIFESVPVGICLSDVDAQRQRTRLINHAHLAICGITREESVVGVFERLTHPEDLERQSEFRRQLDEGSIDQFSLEKRYIRPDGQIVWVVFTVQRSRYADGGWRDLSTVVDVTNLKRAEEEAARQQARFKFIFESVPVGIALTHSGGSQTFLANPAHDRITGLSGAELEQPGAFDRVTHPEDLAGQRKLTRQYKRGEIDRFTIEKRYVHPGGKTVWVTLARRRFTDATSGLQQSITTLIDITERKAAEAKLAETHKQLLDLSRQSGMAEVATGVLHNVGNVLNSVNVSATLVMDQVAESKITNLAKIGRMLRERNGDMAGFLIHDPKGRQIPPYLVTLADDVMAENKMVTEELGHLRKNIEHIKDIVAMQQSYARTSGVSETIAVTDMVEDALRMNTGSLARHEVRSVRDYRTRPILNTEKHKVLQILVNLIRNAKYACDDSGRSDKLVTLRVTHDEHDVEIAVIDNGIGIPPENLTRIFAHGFTTRKDGHGFGLHSGALAARQLGGSLIAMSNGLGTGATFILKLPFKNQNAS